MQARTPVRQKPSRHFKHFPSLYKGCQLHLTAQMPRTRQPGQVNCTVASLMHVGRGCRPSNYGKMFNCCSPTAVSPARASSLKADEGKLSIDRSRSPLHPEHKDTRQDEQVEFDVVQSDLQYCTPQSNFVPRHCAQESGTIFFCRQPVTHEARAASSKHSSPQAHNFSSLSVMQLMFMGAAVVDVTDTSMSPAKHRAGNAIARQSLRS